MNYFERGVEEIAPIQKQYIENHPFIQAIAQGSVSKANYAAYLVETFHLITETPHYLASAAANSTEDHWLRNWFLDLAVDERGHDKLCLHDLKEMGLPADKMVKRLPGYGAAMMVSHNHYLAQKAPLGVLGFAAATEGMGASLATGIAQLIEEKYPFARGAVSFLKVHGQEDIAHFEAVKKAFNRCASIQDNYTLMVTAWRHTLMSYAQLFTDALAKDAAWLDNAC